MEKQNIPDIIKNLIDDMIHNKVIQRTIKIKDQSKFDKFIQDAKPAIEQKLLRVKINPINNSEAFISLGYNSIIIY